MSSSRVASYLRTPEGLAALALTAVAAVIRFWTLDDQSYWYDEAVTATLLDRSFGGLLDGVVESESTPPLYYVVGWLWAHAFGSDEAPLRALSAIAGTLVVPVAFAAGRLLVSVRAGLAAAALAAVSPMLVWYSQEARAYSLLALLGGLSFVLFALARTTPSARRLGLWTGVSSLALLTHYFAGFVVVPEALLLLYAYPRSRRVRVAVAAAIAVGVALLPLAAVQASHGRIGWISQLDLDLRATEALRRLLTPGPPPSWAGATSADFGAHLWLVALALLVVAAAMLVVLGSRRERLGGAVALAMGGCALLAPIALAVVADAVANGDGDVFLDRNVLGAWVPLGVGVAAGLTARRAGWLGPAVVAALVVWSVVVVVDVARSPELQRDDWRRVAPVLPTRSGLVVVYPAYQVDALTRQRPDLRSLDGTTEADRIVLVLPGFRTPPATFRVPAAFRIVATRRLQSITVVEYVAPTVRAVGRDDVADGPPESSDLSTLATPA